MESNFKVLKDEKKVVMERIFDAPRDLVWRAYTEKDLIAKWWGPKGFETIIEKMEVKVGGVWRFIHKEKDGKIHPFHGVYKEVKKPEIISRTFNYEPIGPGHEMIETAIFEEIAGGQTKVTATASYSTIEDLEGMVNMGMEWGEKEGAERLAELLNNLKNEK